jgi:hypothetical protein
MADHHKDGSDNPPAYPLAELIEDLVIVPPSTKPSPVFISDNELHRLDSHDILSRMLSCSSFISWKWYDEAADLAGHLADSRKIGQGQCGTIIFPGHHSTEFVIKMPNSAEKEAQLYVDAQVHAVLDKCFRSAPVELRSDLYVSFILPLFWLFWLFLDLLLRFTNDSVQIPQYKGWLTPAMEKRWAKFATWLPHEYNISTSMYALVSERIPPVPAPIRSALIDNFCPKKVRQAARDNPENTDCLVRLYLGKREADSHKGSFRLRNFPLFINDIEELEIDPSNFARIMADALAIMHWSANIDGNDVEFVLGSPPVNGTLYANGVGERELQIITKDSPLHQNADIDNSAQTLHMWLLDFNQCSFFDPASFGENELKLLTDAYWFNDPYFPRPVSDVPADRALWKDFADRYLYASNRLTESEAPAQFIRAIEKEGGSRRAKVAKHGKNSLFGALAG